MRHILLITVLIININTYAQHSFEYFHSNDEDWVHFIETKDNKLAFFMDDSLFFFSQEGEILEKRQMYEGNYSVWSFAEANNGGYLTTGLYDSTGEEDYQFWLKKYDDNFNTLWEKTTSLDFKRKKVFWTWDCIQNYDNDIMIVIDTDSIMFGEYPDSCYLYQFTETGELIIEKKFEDYPSLKNGKIVQIPDTTGYLFSAFDIWAGFDGTDCIFKLNNDFSIDTIYNTEFSNNLEYQRHPNIKFLSDTTFIFAGMCYPEFTAISLYDTAFNEIKNVIFDTDHDFGFNEVAAFKGLDWVDTSAIYLSYIDPGVHYYPPQELNYSKIVKLNSSLDIQWEKFYGDSSTISMVIKHTYATNDGGCIISGDMQFAPFDEWKVKSFIVKLDAEGNLPASIKESKIKAYELILYPNPGNAQLKIRTAVQRIGGEFKMFDISGKLVFQKYITESTTTINTEYLPSGAYIYSYTHEGEVVENGKWAKE